MITCLSSAGAAVARHALLSLLLWPVLLPAAENTAIILNIEEPRAGAVYQGVANLRGWAVAPQGVERIAAYLNGAYVFDIPQGGLREDVAAHPVYGTYPGAATSGFSMALNYGDRPAGQYSLRIRAFDRLGDYRDRSVSFNSIAFPNPYIVHTPEAPKVRLDPNNTVINALGPSVFAIAGVRIEDQDYTLTLRWRDQQQGFAIETIDAYTPEFTQTWMFTDQGFIAGGQNGALREYEDLGEVVASPWTISDDGSSLRLDWEDDANCRGYNNYIQTATATAVIKVEVPTVMTITWSGIGETQDDGYEFMSLSLTNSDVESSLIGEAQAPGGQLGCEGGMAAVVSDPPPPQQVNLSPGSHVLYIYATTNDPLYHFGAWYAFDLSFTRSGL